ncbi:polysaccharide deacetylase family protein [Paenibacillus oenotherae]|nr:polysaccharide deacetylase family protein [Paenibacillus oenotherae]
MLTFYAFLPGLVSRTFGFRVFKRGRAKNEIALTFDDGPDPKYTPLLLDLLKRHDAKATFFVVGVHAEKHPELLQRMRDEGHIIGIHNYVHKTNWFMRPSSVKRQIHRTSDIIKKATGVRAAYYRPPWGIVNLFDFSNLGYLQIILWSTLFGDWRKRVGAERLLKRMLKKLRPGEVLLLHDCGSTFGADYDAPANMLAALEPFLIEGKRRGFQFVHIAEMIAVTDRARASNRSLSLFKRMIVACWLVWERIFHVLFRIQEGGTDSIFHYRKRKYRGKALQLSEGRTIEDGDEVIELHLDNSMLFRMMMESRSLMHVAILLIREVEKAMPKLAEQFAGKEEYANVRGLYGISMINRGAAQFGFTVLELQPGLFDRLTRFYLKLLMFVLHPSGKKRVRGENSRLSPRIIAMSMEELFKRYSTRGDLKPVWNKRSAYDGALQPAGKAAISHSAYDNANTAREFTP